MAFVPKTGAGAGKIHCVTIGRGESALTIGGSRALPFYSFDAPGENPPAIGVAVSDRAPDWEAPDLRAYYAGCMTLAERIRQACAMEGADFVCLHLEAADPNGENREVKACVAEAREAARAATLPLVIMGCQNIEKDSLLFTEIAKALQGQNVLLLSARNENYRAVGEAALACGHKLGAETADDVNLAKQLNIMLSGMGVPENNIVMNIGTAAVGYGFEYVVSTLDRVRFAALEQDDRDLQMPILAPVCLDTWGVKESTATEEDEPAWGDREARCVSMEVATAAACLTSGADGVILRHPASVGAVKRFVASLW